MTTASRDLEQRLNQAAREAGGSISHAVVLDIVDSTQDEARRRGSRPGEVIVALVQTAGRGRRGRTWLDSGDHGLAASFVYPAREPQRLAIQSAVAAARAIESLASTDAATIAGIKWPNDLVLARRKVGGVLVEVRDGRAIVGIGINVSQQSWPPDLIGRAISLHEAGIAVDRAGAAVALIDAVAWAEGLNDADLRQAFARRDVLSGSQGRVRHRQEEFEGTLRIVDPLHEIAIETAMGSRTLAAEATTILTADHLFSPE